ncbi:permease [Chloroherpeton thalassium]|nr:permease [Chloroherpeton thalassium]
MTLILFLIVAIYLHLEKFADIFLQQIGLSRDTHFGESLHFFVYEIPKVLMLLVVVVFAMGVIQTFVSPERTRALLSGRKAGLGNFMAAGLGIVTPFCSCSAVPLFIGFLQAGVPLGVTFSFLIAAPMVNEIALALLFGMFGWNVAGLYLAMGLSIAIVAGIVIGSLNMEYDLEEWVQSMLNNNMRHHAAASEQKAISWSERLQSGFAHVREIVGKVWLYIILGVGLGAGIHGYVPQDFMASLMGKSTWWSVPIAILLGVPLYSNAAGIFPIIQALLGKGVALGTAMAFMMSVIALSAPEMIILRKVLKPKLIAVFVSIVTAGILTVGYVFNLLL